MNFRCSPSGILDCYLPDQCTKLDSESRFAGTVATEHSPIESKTGTMPADYRVGFHDPQYVSPPGPDLP